MLLIESEDISVLPIDEIIDGISNKVDSYLFDFNCETLMINFIQKLRKLNLIDTGSGIYYYENPDDGEIDDDKFWIITEYGQLPEEPIERLSTRDMLLKLYNNRDKDNVYDSLLDLLFECA